MTVQEYDEHESERMKDNAWMVSKELVSRLDGAPVWSEYIHGLLSDSPSHHFFFNGEELKAYMLASANGKMSLPGSGYFSKIFDFMESHYEYGELYMEYLRYDCLSKGKDGQICDYCSGISWQGPEMTRIPRPYPDCTLLSNYHYKDVLESPLVDEDGTPRKPDDFAPRAALKREFEDGSISLDDDDAIGDFSEKYIVEKSLVEEYLKHLKQLENLKQMRSAERQKKTDEKMQKRVQ